jgi:hypothetical protein
MGRRCRQTGIPSLKEKNRVPQTPNPHCDHAVHGLPRWHRSAGRPPGFQFESGRARIQRRVLELSTVLLPRAATALCFLVLAAALRPIRVVVLLPTGLLRVLSRTAASASTGCPAPTSAGATRWAWRASSRWTWWTPSRRTRWAPSRRTRWASSRWAWRASSWGTRRASPWWAWWPAVTPMKRPLPGPFHLYHPVLQTQRSAFFLYLRPMPPQPIDQENAHGYEERDDECQVQRYHLHASTQGRARGADGAKNFL